MKAIVVASPSAEHQTSWGGVFADGLRRHGWEVDILNRAKPADLLVLWGVRNSAAIEMQKAQGGEVCILERGYLGDRFKWASVSFGGKLNNRAEFRGVSSDPSRFNTNFGHLMQPWRRQTGYALLIGQVPGDMSLAAVGGKLDRWYADMAAELQGLGYEVRFREHPEAVKRGYRAPRLGGVSTMQGDLATAIGAAELVVCFNSNTSVESVLAGIPTITADVGAMAWPVTGHDPGDVIVCDRGEWAAQLSWRQWTMDEIASGYCWEVVGARECVQAA
jgi:hypothetical protein